MNQVNNVNAEEANTANIDEDPKVDLTEKLIIIVIYVILSVIELLASEFT